MNKKILTMGPGLDGGGGVHKPGRNLIFAERNMKFEKKNTLEVKRNKSHRSNDCFFKNRSVPLRSRETML